MIVDKLEDTLNGGFGGLYGEVVTCDTYKLKELDFVPRTFIDCGANIGITLRFARQLFPDCLIIAVEPHPQNIEILKFFTNDNNLILIEKAIGNGKVYRGLTAANGSGETYLSGDSLGYPEKDMVGEESLVATNVETITIAELIKTYVKKGDKFIVKIDIEGSENTIWTDEESMRLLRTADYVCAEVHFYSITGGKVREEMLDVTEKALKSFETTHDCLLEGVHFWAKLKK